MLKNEKFVFQVLFSGPGQEQTLVSAGDDKTLRLWDARSGKEVLL